MNWDTHIIDRFDILTIEEKTRWVGNDPEGYTNWCWRVVYTDNAVVFDNKKLPRHRYNKDPRKP